MIKLITLRLLETFFRHRWLYMLPPVLLLAAGVAFAFLVPQEYEASGSMMIEKESLLATLTSNGSAATLFRTPASITVGELNELLATDAFVRAAIGKTELEARMNSGQQSSREVFQEFRKALSIYPLGDKLMEVSATHREPLLSQQIATATVDSYIQWQINKDYQQSVVAQGFFANQITPIQEELKNARANMQAYLESYSEPLRGERPPEEQIEIRRLESDIARADDRLTETLKNEESARLAVAKAESITRQTYMVIDTPSMPSEDFSLRRVALYVIIFTLAGFFLSIAALVVLALLDRTLRWPVDVHHALSLPLLATLGSDLPQAGQRTQRVAKESRATARSETASPKGAMNPRA